MNSLRLILTYLIASLLFVTVASAQIARVHRHRDPNLPSSSAISAPSRGPTGGVDAVSQAGESALLSKDGDVVQTKGDWEMARSKYLSALNLWPDNPVALYGLAKCAENDGDTAAAIGFYRTSIYSHDPKVYGTTPGDGYRTNDVRGMMEYVLLLSQAHQDNEAQQVYKRAAHVLNYQDSQFTGRPFLKVLLPEFGTGSGQVAYMAQRLQAMAHVTLSIQLAGIDPKAAMPEIQKALQLYPDAPVVNYYLGERLYSKGDNKGAKAAYEKAAQLGDAKVGAAAHEALKNVR